MNTKTLSELILAVIFSREVLAITVIIAVYLNIVFYVLHYRKRPAAPKRKRAVHAAKAAGEAAEAEVTDEE